MKGTAVVKKPHYTIVKREDHLAAAQIHPLHGLTIQVSVTSSSRRLGSRVAQAERELKSNNVWTIFRHFAPQAEATEEELVEAMDGEIPGLGQVARVFGTHQGPEGREEGVWMLLAFFMNVHGVLQRSPRLAWQDKKLRPEVLRLARLYGNQVAL